MISSGFDSNYVFSNGLQERVFEVLNVRNNLCRFYFENKSSLDSLIDSDLIKSALSPYYCTLNPYGSDYRLYVDSMEEHCFDIDSNALTELSVLFNKFFKVQTKSNFMYLNDFFNSELGFPDVLAIKESLPHGVFYDISLPVIIERMDADEEFLHDHKIKNGLLAEKDYFIGDFDVTFDFFYSFINR